MHGQGKDTVGGGTSTGLAQEIKKYECISNEEEFMMSTRSIHDHNACIKSPADEFLGQGGVNYRTSLQLAFTNYALKK